MLEVEMVNTLEGRISMAGEGRCKSLSETRETSAFKLALSRGTNAGKHCARSDGDLICPSISQYLVMELPMPEDASEMDQSTR